MGAVWDFRRHSHNTPDKLRCKFCVGTKEHARRKLIAI